MSQLRLITVEDETRWIRDAGNPTAAEKKLREIPSVQNPTVAWARRHGCRATKLQGMGNRAEPDYLFRIPGGRPFLVEFKRPGEVPTPLQTVSIRQWQQDGYDVEVHDTKESAIAAIQKRMDACKR